jgi:hypothetical protein
MTNLTNGFDWDGEDGQMDPILEAHLGPVIDQLNRENIRASSSFDGIWEELPKTITRWDWFSQRKYDCIPRLIKKWETSLKTQETFQTGASRGACMRGQAPDTLASWLFLLADLIV